MFITYYLIFWNVPHTKLSEDFFFSLIYLFIFLFIIAPILIWKKENKVQKYRRTNKTFCNNMKMRKYLIFGKKKLSTLTL